MLAGLATALFSGIGLVSVVAAEADHNHGAPEAVSLSRVQEPLPGGDSTVPGAALGLLLASAGLTLLVRRSAPVSAAPVADVSPLPSPDAAEPTPVTRTEAA
jgi:hypothetical protein